VTFAESLFIPAPLPSFVGIGSGGHAYHAEVTTPSGYRCHAVG